MEGGLGGRQHFIVQVCVVFEVSQWEEWRTILVDALNRKALVGFGLKLLLFLQEDTAKGVAEASNE